MNMPFELGIDYGNYIFNNHSKKMLVLEGRRYDYQKALSDISGVDVKCHNNEPEDIIKCIRHWMIEAAMVESADSPTLIWYQFNLFASYLYDSRKTAGFSDDDLNDMPTPEYIKAIEHWVNEHNA
jgi:aromatic ring-opening dioxygenase catalytic subunit (LigB family)